MESLLRAFPGLKPPPTVWKIVSQLERNAAVMKAFLADRFPDQFGPVYAEEQRKAREEILHNCRLNL
jgi:hypothetical protein